MEKWLGREKPDPATPCAQCGGPVGDSPWCFPCGPWLCSINPCAYAWRDVVD